jgi:hypothetical protein
MAGLLRTQVRLPVGRELFLLLCVGICERQRNGKILLDRYCCKRRHSAGDERVCHQPVTPTCQAIKAKVEKSRPRRFSGGKIVPEPASYRVSSDTCIIFPTRNRSCLDVLLHGSARRSGIALLLHGAGGPRALHAGVLRRRPGTAGRRAVLHRAYAGRRAVIQIVAGGHRRRSARMRITADGIALCERGGAGECESRCERNGFHLHLRFLAGVRASREPIAAAGSCSGILPQGGDAHRLRANTPGQSSKRPGGQPAKPDDETSAPDHHCDSHCPGPQDGVDRRHEHWRRTRQRRARKIVACWFSMSERRRADG